MFTSLIGTIVLDPTQTTPPTVAADPLPTTNRSFGFDFINGVEEAAGRATPIDTWYNQARAAGASWNRWPIYWFKVEPQPGQLVYDGAYNVDRVVEADVQHGVQTNAILIGTPSWASAAGSLTGEGLEIFDIRRKFLGAPPVGPFQVPSPAAVPRGLDLPVFVNGAINPANTWAYFVYQTVNRYKPGGVLAQARGWAPGQGIRVWEVWNEPDSRYPVFWAAGPTEYARLLKVAALAARAADPAAVILFAGLAYWSQPDFLGRVLDQIVADPEASTANFYFDVLPLHLYVDPWHIVNVTIWARGELARRGLRKAIWVNETNAPIWGDSTPYGPGAWRATPAEQANFAIQAQALQLVADVDRLLIFQLYEDGEPAYGVIRQDGSIRPAYTAAQVAATYLNGATLVGETRTGTVEAIVALVPGRGRVTVIWNRSTQQVVAQLTATTPWATLVDRTGSTRIITAMNNAYGLTLPPGADHSYDPGNGQPPITWHADGEPFLIVEPVYQLVSSRVEPLPSVSSARGFVVRWHRLDSINQPAWYDVQYRVDDGPWQNWILGSAITEAPFGKDGDPVTLKPGSTYRFRVRARIDSQVETWPSPDLDGDTWTRIATRAVDFPLVRR